MNKNRFRVLFNQARSQMMVVAETALSSACAAKASRPATSTNSPCNASSCFAVIRQLVFAVLVLSGNVLWLPDAAADIIADHNAPASQQPIITSTANGIPQVNIQTPSTAGVSHNTYSQFDVNARGAILNNARTSVQTQLGGFVQGNPALAAGTARVILNEVNSSNPSLLNGYVEIAGSRAQVVIANPAGISCDGCGFINANRATLTTGTPIINDGNLLGYRVGGGSISFLGAGMDSSQTSYTDIIARAVKVNAGIFANELNIVTGANQIDINSDGKPIGITPKTSNSLSSPAYAIDVAALGGMYAGKIRLIGTEAGLGVRNAGNIGASVGEVVISADGRLQNSGRISSAGNATISANAGIDNSGSVYGTGNASFATLGDITNSGTLAAQGDVTLDATGVASQVSSSSGSLLAAGLQADGSFASSGNLTLSASQGLRLNGQNLAGGDISATAAIIDVADSQTRAKNLVLTATAGDIDASRAAVDATQALVAHAGNLLRSDHASLTADRIELAAHDLSNVQGEIGQTGAGDIALLLAGGLDNTQGRITSNSENLSLAAQTLNNSGGTILHAGHGSLNIEADTLDGTGGSIASNGNLYLAAQTAILDAGNTTAALIEINAGSLSNRSGEIIQSGDGATLSIHTSGDIDNTLNGRIAGDGSATIDARQLLNSTGTITAGQGLAITTDQALDNRQGTLAANQDVALSAASVNNVQGNIGSALAGIMLSAGNGAIDNSAGRVVAAEDVTITGDGITNAEGTVSGANLLVDSHAQALDNTRGIIAAQQKLNLQSGRLNNNAGLIAADEAAIIDTHSQALINSNSLANGGIVAQDTLTLNSGELNNQAGFIAAKGDLNASSANISNTQGGILSSESALALTATSFDNRGGQVQVLGDLNVNAGNGTVDNTASLLRSGSRLSIAAGSVINANTLGANQGMEGRDVAIAADRLDNSSGAIRADDTLTLGGHAAINNAQGLISSGATLAIHDSNLTDKAQSINNNGGTIIAGTDVNIDSASLSGDGSLLSHGDLSAALISDFDNTGAFQADGTATLQTSGTITNQAKLTAGETLGLKAAAINNQAGGEISASNLQLEAINAGLTNRGLINAQETILRATTLNNIGTGRIYGDHVAIATSSLVNGEESVNGITTAATIAARERLDIGAQSIGNREHALIFSAADASIGGNLDANGQASGQATTLDNSSASIEALGNLDISAAQITNSNAHFSTVLGLVGSEARDSYQLSGSANIYDSSRVSFIYRNGGILTQLNAPDGSSTNFYHYDYTRTTQETRIATSDPAKILSGGDMQIHAGSVLNNISHIIAGGDITGAIGSLNNTEVAGSRTITDSGALYYLHEKKISGDDNNPTITQYFGAYNPARIVQNIRLTPTVYRQNTAPSGSGTQLASLSTSRVSQAAAGASTAIVSIAGAQPVDTITEVAAIDNGTAGNVGTFIRSGGVNITIPTNSLFTTNAAPGAHYLIETDPQFANYRTWLSSDYALQQLMLDPATTQKRLGDGFYEQRLIREQVAQLTGRRFLNGYASDEAQYQALLTAGVTAARSWQLIPGVALTPEQIAQLTSDIVWLVAREVTLADGSKQNLLVPQLYVRVQEGDLLPSGALVAGNNIHLDLSGDLSNAGTIAGRNIVSLTADNIRNLGGRISAANVALDARTDLNNIGGLIEANDRLSMTAGRDINVVSTTGAQSGPQGNRTNINRVAGLYVSDPGGVLVASAGRDINLMAASIINSGMGGTTVLDAGNNLSLGTVNEASSQANAVNSKNYMRTAKSTDVGSTIQTTGDIVLQSGHDITTHAASITSDDGNIRAVAGNDIVLATGKATQTLDEGHKTKSHGFLSSKTRTTHNSVNESFAEGTTISGDTVSLLSGNDIDVTGSNAVSTNGTSLNAAGNINIIGATNTRAELYEKKIKKSGFSASGASISFGTSSLKANTDTDQATNVASTVGSTAGDIEIKAGKNYKQTGSDVLAPEGNINIEAQKVDITAAENTSAQKTETKFKQSGITLALSNPVIDAIQTAQQLTQAASQTSDGRMQALAAGTVALAASNAYDMVQAGQAVPPTGNKALDAANQVGGINISLSIGSSKSSSKSTQNRSQAQGSQITAGNDINIKATGAATNSDINVIGSTISAGNNVALNAEDQINLLAAKNTASQHSKNKSSSASVGVSFGTSGFAVTASASKGRGNADGNDVSWTESIVQGGNQVKLESGTDTNLIGAQVRGNQVTANVGNSGVGNLNIQSLQDTSTYDSKQKSAGLSISVPIGAGNFGGSLSASKSNINSDYASVVEQSGIYAGDDGFQVNVNGNTNLAGAVIASTEQAIQGNKNRLATETLTTRDIQNSAEYKGQATSATVGGGIEQGLPTLSGAGIGSDDDEADSVTVSGISSGVVNVTDNTAQEALTGKDAVTTVALLNRDVVINDDGEAVDSQGNPTANTIAPIFDKEKVEREIQAQVQITQAFNQHAPKVLATFALSKTQPYQDAMDYQLIEQRVKSGITLNAYEVAKLIALESSGMTLESAQAMLNDPEAKSDYENWNGNGDYRRAANIIIAAIGGGSSGLTSVVTKESLSWAADQMREYMKKDSEKFAGLCASPNDCINNTSGVSVGINGDNLKEAGGRIVLEVWCEKGGADACQSDNNTKSKYKENPDGTVIFKPKDIYGNALTISQFIDQHQELRSELGGAQGGSGQMKLLGIQFEYVTGSFWDKLAESYAGTHDTLNNIIWYDELGNGKNLDKTLIGQIGNVTNSTNVLVATPFALSVLLPPEVWGTIFSLTKP